MITLSKPHCNLEHNAERLHDKMSQENPSMSGGITQEGTT